ncbi:MAG: hypothetical protein AAGJ81_10760 [Verrucomicrobiota bacterium]
MQDLPAQSAPMLGSSDQAEDAPAPVYVSPYFDDDGMFLGTMVGGTFIPDGPGSPMIQSALTQLSTPEGWWEGWINFFTASDRKFAHVEMVNGILINAYAEYQDRFYANNKVKIPNEFGDIEVPVGQPWPFDMFAKYFIAATSPAQEMGVDVWSGLAVFGAFKTFETVNNAMDSVNATNQTVIEAGAQGAAGALEGVGAGVEATVTGAGLFASP